MKVAVVILVGSIVAMYVCGAFVSWQPNPAKWDEFGRLLFVMLSLFISGFTSKYYYDTKK
jgi:hypothetical protein